MSLFLLLGDSFLRETETKSIIQKIQKKIKSEPSIQKFDLSAHDLSDILTQARSLPFLVDAQIFLVRQSNKLKEGDIDLLEAYSKEPIEFTTLIFEADSFNEKLKVFKKLSTLVKVLKFETKNAKSQAQQFMNEKLKNFSKRISAGAGRQLLEMCGEQIVFLDTMLDRLIDYSGDETEITEVMVGEFQENWGEMNIYQITNAISRKDLAGALNIFREMVHFYQADLISMIGFLHWQIKQLWQARVLLDHGVSDQVILQRCRVPSWRGRQFIGEVRQFSTKKLEEAIENLYQLDINIKTGQSQGDSGLEKWLVELVA